MEYSDNERQDDQHLVQRVLRGDTEAFRSIIDRTQGLVTQIVFKMISNQEDRRDVAQDIYLKVFNKLGSFQYQSKLSTWVWQIAFNTCANYLKKKKLILFDQTVLNSERHEEMAEFNIDEDVFANDIEKGLIHNDLKRILNVEIDKLSPLYKTLITLYHIEETSYSEMAQIVGLPEGTVKSYLFRARKILKEQLSVAYKNGTL